MGTLAQTEGFEPPTFAFGEQRSTPELSLHNNYTFHRVWLSHTLLLPTITRLSAIEASFYETYEKLLSAVFGLLTSVIIVGQSRVELESLDFQSSAN